MPRLTPNLVSSRRAGTQPFTIGGGAGAARILLYVDRCFRAVAVGRPEFRCGVGSGK